jgi:hypothetical protein
LEFECKELYRKRTYTIYQKQKSKPYT